ncbi:hypothetical protein ACFL1H_00205 [Nanoarchaeota archaeon]
MLAVVALILLPIAYYFVSTFGDISDDELCRASAIASAALKLGTGVETIYVDCATHYRDVKLGDINMPLASAEVDKFEKVFGKSTAPKDKELYEYRLNQLVSEELRKCWYNLGEGNLNLFGEWYNPEEKTDSGWLGTLTHWKNYIKVNVFSKADKDIPLTCVICARMKFGEEVKDKFTTDEISLTTWMKIHSLPNKAISYYDYTIDELHDPMAFTPNYKYKLDEPYAVVFARYADPWLKKRARDFFQLVFGVQDKTSKQEAYDLLMLIPYSEVTKVCDIIAN